MGLPVVDIIDKITVDNSAYDDDHTYSYKSQGRYLLVKEISIAGDSVLLSDGRVQMFFAGRAFTSQGGAGSEIQLIKTLTLNYERKDRVILEPNESVDIKFRTTSGSAEAQVALIGVSLTKEEYDALMAE